MEAAPYQKHVYDQQRQNADKTQFFAYNCKYKVVLRLRQIQMLLDALAKSQQFAEPTDYVTILQG